MIEKLSRRQAILLLAPLGRDDRRRSSYKRLQHPVADEDGDKGVKRGGEAGG
ncbi:hypothetical protein CLV36_105141 [Laceyella sediminis]|uniref:Uncharacterized protein n=1 Tax=Laceyella sediminis TaxID=573074 RepID=A0ABX5EPI5_9BACL|nr:hypothetical protein [Laceyella sediminis]PRZ14826.1 hypothetical protein CLV36_105141 [Laceyella sediminis]